MFFKNFLIFYITSIITIFLFFSLYSQSNTFEVLISNFILNSAESLIFSTPSENYGLLQFVNAENIIGNDLYMINNLNSTANNINRGYYVVRPNIGAWAPLNHSLILQNLKGKEQKNAINILLKQGFHEYYFAMNNFEDTEYSKLTEELLKAAEQTDLKIIIILRPPSEGDSNTNYYWKGWIKYFNSLEKKYPKSFDGFTIDDFNWISTRDDTKFENNIDFMEYSKLIKALRDKDKDINFYPTIYFQGKRTDKVFKKYDDYIDGLIVANGCYYNVSTLAKEFTIFKEIFEKPIRYVVYPTITYNYSRQGYNPPTDRLIQATLSIASNFADGLIIFRDTDKPVIQEYLANKGNKEYLEKISKMKELQIKDEKISTANLKRFGDLPDAEQYINCQKWSDKFNKAYDKWNDLSQEKKEKDKWKKEIFKLIKKK